jgi:flagellar M-ring protein FliF
MERLSAFARKLGPTRLAIIAAVLATTLGLFAFIIMRVGAVPMALLYGDLDGADAARIVAELERQGVPYRLDHGGTTVFAPADQVPKLRVKLAEAGLPSGGSVGYELFDQTSTLGATSFQQNVNLVRALEGELARTIRAIETVRAARVHLVLPKRELFSRDRQQASASVLLQMKGNARLSPAQIVAVQNLIASAVPELKPERISIVDGHGTLLSERGGDDVATLSTKADERRRQLEARLRDTVEELLERVIGPGKVRTQVFAEMDFDRINTSEEVFDPEGQVVRSTQTVAEQNASEDADASKPVSVATNLPDPPAAPAGASGSRSTENRKEETINYEISKKVINHVREAGVIKRLSVAVLVDGLYTKDESGAVTYTPRPAAEMEQISTLIKGAIGFNAERGDRLEVISMRFVEPAVEGGGEAGWLPHVDEPSLWRFAQYLLLTLFGVLIALFVIRPVLSRALDGAVPATGPRLAVAGAAAAGVAAGEAAPSLSAPDQHPALPHADSVASELIDVAGVEGKVRSSVVQQVGDIAAKYPDETLALVRNWLHGEEQG